MEHFGACEATVIIISFSALCTMAKLFKNNPKMDHFFQKYGVQTLNEGFNQSNEFRMFILF